MLRHGPLLFALILGCGQGTPKTLRFAPPPSSWTQEVETVESARLVRPGETERAPLRETGQAAQRLSFRVEQVGDGVRTKTRHVSGGKGPFAPYLGTLELIVRYDANGRLAGLDGFEQFYVEMDAVDPRLGLQLRGLRLDESARADLMWQQQAWIGKAPTGPFDATASLHFSGWAGVQELSLRWEATAAERCPEGAEDEGCVALRYRSAKVDPAAAQPEAKGPALLVEGRPVRGVEIDGVLIVGARTGLEYRGELRRAAFLVQDGGALIEREQRVTRRLVRAPDVAP